MIRRFWRRAAIASLIAFSLWFASEWWEKGLASPWGEAKQSPNGCSSIQAFEPFWLLPNILHGQAIPNEGGKINWPHTWELPGFYRLYDNYNGQVIGETVIYDLAFSGGRLNWDQDGGVWAGMTYVGPTIRDCIGAIPESQRSQ
ncbi:hypothetical protein V0R50_18035 [Pseudomonas sp. 148P]|uniref:Secreted protein n=1 Tax=Pseudomonas ulcerans TaxID=3115852 RepID=A0ABU7HUL6_9PSED|nr:MULTISPECIES: hypothetical protein [unclassified Pseudomonas]MEE1923956.1 hypothetical protein [Pseudomonas sp. 147P]MEE1935133.1 hypothetical protein [Pseudomonas sp. 148P]